MLGRRKPSSIAACDVAVYHAVHTIQGNLTLLTHAYLRHNARHLDECRSFVAQLKAPLAAQEGGYVCPGAYAEKE